jgi:hypothetical protein
VCVLLGSNSRILRRQTQSSAKNLSDHFDQIFRL